MTEVLTIATRSDGGFGSNTPRRSSSQPSLLLQNPVLYGKSNSRSSTYVHHHPSYESKAPASEPSSAPSSPRFQPPDYSNQPSYLSTPSSSLSLDDECDLVEDDILFPSYDDTPEETEPPPSPDLGPVEDESGTCSDRTQLNLSCFDKFDTPQSAADDISVKIEPSRHVDYLSHDWKEEDIWCSWRHIVGNRHVYKNRSNIERASWTRLENASWRTWAKSRNRLKTVSPEKLNWMKDHDVTWLYGPLQTGKTQTRDSYTTLTNSQLSRTNSFATKKPILKKRSLSELMLQRSISSSTLMKQAVDALRAQQPDQGLRLRPVLGVRAYSDYIHPSSPMTPGDPTNAPSSIIGSSSSSGAQTPSERRHIHFNDKVEQCIAINKEPEDDYHAIDDDSSDDGIIMMSPVHGKARKLSNIIGTPRGSFSNESKTIAMLPSTTLRGDTPEPAPPDPKQQARGLWGVATRLVTSSSQETLKPSKPSANFLLDDEDEEADMCWQPATSHSSRKGSMYIDQSQMGGISDEEEDEMEGRGMRRTPSGMFMPYEEDEDDIVAAGLFGKVVDTVNTAKDIAHVIWNVGWRR